MIRVAIADDQALVRSGFRLILDGRPDIEVVGEAEDGQQAVELARRLSPDVLLLDIRMPNLDGIEATRRIIGEERRDRQNAATRTRQDRLLPRQGLGVFLQWSEDSRWILSRGSTICAASASSAAVSGW